MTMLVMVMVMVMMAVTQVVIQAVMVQQWIAITLLDYQPMMLLVSRADISR